MANKYDTMVSSIVDLVGGKENIRSFAHCVTRLRFNVKDKGLVDEAKIRELPGAVGTQWSGNQLQVIIGNDVENVYKQIAKANNLAVEPEVSAKSEDEKQKNIVVKLIEMLSGCVIPLVPILMGAGMIKVFYLLAVRLGILSTESSTYIVLDFVNNAAFSAGLCRCNCRKKVWRQYEHRHAGGCDADPSHLYLGSKRGYGTNDFWTANLRNKLY